MFLMGDWYPHLSRGFDWLVWQCKVGWHDPTVFLCPGMALLVCPLSWLSIEALCDSCSQQLSFQLIPKCMGGLLWMKHSASGREWGTTVLNFLISKIHASESQQNSSSSSPDHGVLCNNEFASRSLVWNANYIKEHGSSFNFAFN